MRIESTACERLGLTLPRADGAAAAEPDEGWLEGLDEALVDLPEPQQEAIRLRVIEELGYDQVADALGTTREAARVRVHRGLSKLPHPTDRTNEGLTMTDGLAWERYLGRAAVAQRIIGADLLGQFAPVPGHG